MKAFIQKRLQDDDSEELSDSGKPFKDSNSKYQESMSKSLKQSGDNDDYSVMSSVKRSHRTFYFYQLIFQEALLKLKNMCTLTKWQSIQPKPSLNSLTKSNRRRKITKLNNLKFPLDYLSCVRVKKNLFPTTVRQKKINLLLEKNNKIPIEITSITTQMPTRK